MHPLIPLEGGGLIVNRVRLLSLRLVDGAGASSPCRSFGVCKFGQKTPPNPQTTKPPKTILSKYRTFSLPMRILLLVVLFCIIVFTYALFLN